MIREFYGRHRRAIVLAASLTAAALTVLCLARPDLAAAMAIVLAWTFAAGIYLVERYEKIESLGGRVVAALGFLSSRAERIGISADMQGQLNGARKAVEDELDGVLPHPVRVVFVRTPREVADLAEGEVVITLSDHRRRAENIARAALAYTNVDLVRPARPYVDPAALKAVDLAVAKRLLGRADGEALDYFLREIYETALQGNTDLQDLCHEVEVIERHGLLSRLVLTEYLDLGRRLYPEFPHPAVWNSSRGLIGHIHRIITKRPDEDLGPALMYLNGHLRVGVVLVADRDMADRNGVKPYVWRALDDIKRGCDAVYLLARGGRVDLLQGIVTGLDGNGRVLAIDGPTRFSVTSDSGPMEVGLVRILADQRGYRDARVAKTSAQQEQAILN